MCPSRKNPGNNFYCALSCSSCLKNTCMEPTETGSHYDHIALWWQQQHIHSAYGLAALERAIRYTTHKATALDIGCGSSGRFIEVLLQHGFTPAGVDVSAAMIALARERHPTVTFYTADIVTWPLPQKYDLLTAWDSTFHLPLAQQQPVLAKLCAGLNPQGILLFTCGGTLGPEEISGGFQGQTFDYSTLGVNEFLRLVMAFGCTCLHVEYDQYPEQHVYVIAQKG